MLALFGRRSAAEPRVEIRESAEYRALFERIERLDAAAVSLLGAIASHPDSWLKASRSAVTRIEPGPADTVLLERGRDRLRHWAAAAGTRRLEALPVLDDALVGTVLGARIGPGDLDTLFHALERVESPAARR